MGMRVGDPLALNLQNDRTDTILRTIGQHLTRTTQMVSRTPACALCWVWQTGGAFFHAQIFFSISSFSCAAAFFFLTSSTPHSLLSSCILCPSPQVIVVLPSNRKDRYDAIKKFCCVDHPVPSQCILGRTLGKKQMMMSVSTKVAMQLDCKLGGELWALEVPVGGGVGGGFGGWVGGEL